MDWQAGTGGVEEDFLAIRDDPPCLAMSLDSRASRQSFHRLERVTQGHLSMY